MIVDGLQRNAAYGLIDALQRYCVTLIGTEYVFDVLRATRNTGMGRPPCQRPDAGIARILEEGSRLSLVAASPRS